MIPETPSPIESTAVKETGRLEAFSDGVFAIAITLLVLELKVPQLPVGPASTSLALGKELARLWPSYFAFVTSFFTVLVMWVHHHAVLRLVRGADAGLLFANGFLLMMVTVVPFPTAIVAQYLMTPAARMACGFYAGTFVLIAIGFQLTLYAGFRPCLLSPGAPPALVRQFRRAYRTGPLYYLLATASALISAWLCLGICTALWVYWALTTVRIAAPEECFE